jgi:hypothetical protein
MCKGGGQVVDARDKPGHDDEASASPAGSWRVAYFNHSPNRRTASSMSAVEPAKEKRMACIPP